MHLRNNAFFLIVVLVALVLMAAAQNPQQQQSQPQQPIANPTAPPASGQQPGVGQPSDAPNQPGSTVRVPQGQQQPGQGQAPTREDNGTYVFTIQSEEVVLHATVVDDKHRLVNGLTRNDFAIFEDGVPQTIRSLRREDIPVALGIIIDNSGSMRDKRPAVNQAAINLVRASNPEDEVFVVNFNDEYYLDQDFTAQIPQLKEALDRIESRGGTALYDAVVASADHLKKNARKEKKVLLVVTDGEDNASRESLEQAIRRLQAENGPTVYTIGILGEEKARRARRALSAMSEQSGGVSFFPKDLSEVDAISQEVAHDIRNQYTITYKPTKPQSQGGYRTVKVEAHAPGYKHLMVRTRSGYYAGQERAAR
jgi:Ca-activated chloride channel homolog